MLSQWRRLAAKVSGRDSTYTTTKCKLDRKLKQAAKRKSKQLDHVLQSDWKKENSRIKLLLLGPGEAGKSTLIKQMQLIHGESIEQQEKMKKIPYIRQNIFDSMVAILVAMKQMGIQLADSNLELRAHSILSHSQVYNSNLSAKDILHSDYLASEEMLRHVQQLWNNNGVHKAYSRSNEYQLLDCAAYFFDRIDKIICADYTPSEQDILRCRVMSTSITETKFTVPYSGEKVNFKVLDVGGQQGERRKWITLFDEVTAVLFMMDASSFDQTLREDSKTSRLLESLKVFYQTVTTRYLRSVSILTFMNKIDILKEKIENGGNFAASIESMKEQARELSQDPSISSSFERGIYTQIHNILTMNPYSTYTPTEYDQREVKDSFSNFAKSSAKETDLNQNPRSSSISSSTTSLTKRFLYKKSKRSSSEPLPDLDWKVLKAAAYLKFILKKIVESVKVCPKYNFQSTVDMSLDTGFRSYEYNYTCAVDRLNIQRVIEGCKNVIIRDYFTKIGITFD